MVKNVSGGNKSKGFARKNFTKKDSGLRVSEDEAEVYAQVTKIFGGAMCQVISSDGTEMLCHIRGKFRGRGKRDNFIGNGTWLLVGLRDWEKEPSAGKLLNCDVIEVYNDADKIRLRNNVTTINWSLFISNDTKTIGVADSEYLDASVSFSDEKTQEYEELIESQVAAAASGRHTTIITEDNEEIDVDDI
jgi:initiation factor 1A